jgi:hypothetical protein
MCRALLTFRSRLCEQELNGQYRFVVWGHVTAVRRRYPRHRTCRAADVKGINVEMCCKMCQSAVLIQRTVVLGVCGVCVWCGCVWLCVWVCVCVWGVFVCVVMCVCVGCVGCVFRCEWVCVFGCVWVCLVVCVWVCVCGCVSVCECGECVGVYVCVSGYVIPRSNFQDPLSKI